MQALTNCWRKALSLFALLGVCCLLLWQAPSLSPTAAAGPQRQTPPKHKRAKRVVTKRQRPGPVKSAAPVTPIHRWSFDAKSAQQAETNELWMLNLDGKRAGFDSPMEAMEYYRAQRIPEGETDIPVEKYFEAQTQMRDMPLYSTADNRFAPAREALRADPDQRLGAWTHLGPGNIGGRTRPMLIHPTNPDIMYLGAVGGGVWKTTNAGQNWLPISDLIANIAVCALAFDPKNPDILYAGTGEGTPNGDAIRGAGIFKTTDAGQTWTRLAATGNNNVNFFFVNDLWVSPNNSNRVYAATRTGVWRSLDAGATWAAVLQTTVAGGCMDLAGRTDQPTDYLLASCGNTAQGAILRKTDAEAAGTWQVVLSDPGMGRAALAFAPSNQNIVYAVTVAFAGTFNSALHAFFRSDNGGAMNTWVARVRNTDANRVNTGILSFLSDATAVECKTSTTNFFSGQAWYDLAIAVDPVDENRVWVGGIDITRSDDGGFNWGAAAFAYRNEAANVVYGDPDQMHPDIHGLFFHPGYNGTSNQQLFVTNDGGIWRTENATARVSTGALAYCTPEQNQVRWRSLNNGYSVTQFYHGSVYPNGTTYLGGTQDNGTPRGSDGGGLNRWNMIFLADGGYSAVDFLNPTKLYVSTQGAGFRKSTDNGETFAIATLGLTGAVTFITPMAADPSDPQRMYTGGQNLNRTDNGMSSWTNAGLIANATLFTGALSAVAAAPTDANWVLVGTSDGSLLRTGRALSLSPTNPLSTLDTVARPRTGVVSWVAFDPANRNIAYATYSTFGGGHVYRTTNGGQSWTNIGGTGATGIPDIPAHCIVVNPANTSRLYVGTDLGVFASLDGGATWAVENTGFANTVVETLVINVANGVTTMYAFTHGRGAYKVALNLSGCNYTLPTTGSRVGAAGGNVTVDVRVAPGGCNWRAESNATWITVAANTGGTSDGTANLSVAANNTFTQRIGTVNIAGRSYTVTQDGQADTEAPTLRVTNPTTLTINTTAGAIPVAGTATDNGRVASVAWRSDRGLSGFAAGTTSWTIAALPLLTGRNVITLSATDDSGNVSGAVTLIVTSMPSSILTTVAGNGVAGLAGNGGPAVLANVANMARLATDSAGNLYIAEFSTSRVRRVAPNGIITTIAGTGTAGFNGDGGPAAAAQLNLPVGLAVDATGNVYIADYGNNRVRRIAANTGIITTFAGTGVAGFSGDNGPAANAAINLPEGLAVDKAGNLYICDSLNHRIRRVDAATSVISTVAGTGTAGVTGDNGPATSATLARPLSVAFDSAENMYISDTSSGRIRRVNVSDRVIRTIAGTTPGFGGDGGPALSAQLGTNVIQITLDGAGNLYLTDTANQRIRRIAADTQTITTIAGNGVQGFTPDGAGAVGASLGLPSGVAIDPAGLVIFGDRTNNRVRRILPGVTGDAQPPVVMITSPSSNGSFTATANPIAVSGTVMDNGTIVSVRWSSDRGGSGAANGTTTWTIPTVALQPGVNNFTISAWDVSGNVGTAQIAISFTAAQTITTIAGTGVQGNAGDGGNALAAMLAQPRGLVVDAVGNVIFADTVNRRVRKISPSGVITAFAGTGELGSSGDGGPATAATLSFPQFLALDRDGSVYISDQSAHRIRKVSPNGIISTVVGTGEGFGGFSGDGGPAKDAQLNNPFGIALDARGNLYIADRSNHRIRRVDAGTGEITTVAGTGLIGATGDTNQAIHADLVQPPAIALDAVGNLYIAEPFTQRIRKVSVVDNRLTTIAGRGVAGFGGDGGPATAATLNLGALTHLAFDRAGDLYFSDQGNHRIRKITMSTGVITTVAGLGVNGFNGDGTAPTGTSLSNPSGIFLDAMGTLFIADTTNQRIRRTLAGGAVKEASNVSAASYAPLGDLSSEMIVSAFGMNFAASTESAASLPLPTSLGGVTVRVRDNLNVERLAPLFFISPGQINYLVPNGTANGLATVMITSSTGEFYSQVVNVASVAPGLFAANANGQGVAAAVALRVSADGTQSYEPVVRLDVVTGRYVAVPIDLGAATDRVFLVLSGTGIRNRTALANVSASIGGTSMPVDFAGPQGSPGFDQVNVLLPRTLVGAGDVEVRLTVDGRSSNTVRVTIR